MIIEMHFCCGSVWHAEALGNLIDRQLVETLNTRLRLVSGGTISVGQSQRVHDFDLPFFFGVQGLYC
jgi:hypothetical protein